VGKEEEEEEEDEEEIGKEKKKKNKKNKRRHGRGRRGRRGIYLSFHEEHRFLFLFFFGSVWGEEGINVRSRSGVYEHVVPILMKGKGGREPTTASGFCGYEEYFFSFLLPLLLLLFLSLYVYVFSLMQRTRGRIRGVCWCVVFAAAVVIVAVLLVLSFCLLSGAVQDIPALEKGLPS
jgi:hypothetical protein